MRSRRILLFLLLAACLPCVAQRLPVLKQIDLPHPYYFREMYLPQLTVGPSAVCWLPDSQTLVYSMTGSLWRQNINDRRGEQLTSGPGYDYQPDCSPDGNWIIYDKYDKDAIELWALDLRDKTTHVLTSNTAVNLEPRFSPDGKRIAFVSTSFHGHFHIFTAAFADGALSAIQQLTEEHKSDLPRYYYSAFDHEISPVWSRDGKEILFISNRGHLYGTGGLWRMEARPGAEMREIHYEETTWKARPDFSPDGKRIVYASYTGGQWHQLWLLDGEGRNPIPLTYADRFNPSDFINPRWSPDGTRIACISNSGEHTWLNLLEIPGGSPRVLTLGVFAPQPSGRLRVQIQDENGKPTAARLSVTGSDGRDYAMLGIHADDSFDRSQRGFERHYFHAKGTAAVLVPAGTTQLEVTRGLAYQVEKRTVEIQPGQASEIVVRMQRLKTPKEFSDSPDSLWLNGDVHTHMNYAGTYAIDERVLGSQADAENLDFVENLIVNKEQRIPDIAAFSPVRNSPNPSRTVFHSQEFHTSYWGHLGLLRLTKNLILPGYAGYPQTAMASIVPMNADIADLAHAQGGLVGYAHPFDTYPDPARDATLTNELPIDVALGKVDYLEVVGFSDHKSTAAVWYHLLNCGFRLPAAGGTDAMANFASLRGPIGLNRTYAQVPRAKPNHDAFLDALKHGRTFATNGPLLGFTLNGQGPGDELKLETKHDPRMAKLHVWLRSIVLVDHLEFVCNGRVVQSFQLTAGNTTTDSDVSIPLTQSGWCLLRAYSDAAHDPILDIYPYATTSPIYVTVEGAPLQSSDDATYFLAWIARLEDAANKFPDYNNDAEKHHVLDLLARARAAYEAKTH